jgi:hypothetical protein
VKTQKLKLKKGFVFLGGVDLPRGNNETYPHVQFLQGRNPPMFYFSPGEVKHVLTSPRENSNKGGVLLGRNGTGVDFPQVWTSTGDLGEFRGAL